MSDNDLTYRVSVNEPDVEDKGDEMVMKNDWLQIEVDRDKDPCREVGDEPNQGRCVRLGYLVRSDMEYT